MTQQQVPLSQLTGWAAFPTWKKWFVVSTVITFALIWFGLSWGKPLLGEFETVMRMQCSTTAQVKRRVLEIKARLDHGARPSPLNEQPFANYVQWALFDADDNPGKACEIADEANAMLH